MKKYILSLISILVIILIPCKVLAVELTDENLESSLSGLINYKVTDSDGDQEDIGILESYSLNTDDKKLTLTSDGETYIMDYTLGETPTFTYSRDITKSITYDEYSDQNDSFIWMIPYVVVAKTQGVNYEDALIYDYKLLLNILEENIVSLMDDSVIIVDDDVDISEYSGTVVRESEYGTYIVDYIKNTYGSTQTLFQDNGIDLFDTFKVEVYATNPTDNSVTINYKLTIDTTKDFSQMNGLFEQLDLELSDVDKALQSEAKPTVLTQKGGQEIKVPNTAVNYPKIIIIVGLLITTIGALFLLKYLNTKTLKVEE